MLAPLAKVLLFLAGMPMLLDLLGKERLRGWRTTAQERRNRIGADRNSVAHARKVEAVARKMARNAERKEGMEALPYFTANEFAAWKGNIYARLGDRDPRSLVPIVDFEQWAREFLLENNRVSGAAREGLAIIHRDIKIRASRHGKIGAALVGVAPPTVAILVCLSGERNAVALGCIAAFCAGWVSMFIWASLRFPTVLLGFLRTDATIRYRLAHTAWILIGRDGNGHPMRWAALAAFIGGSFLNLVTSL